MFESSMANRKEVGDMIAKGAIHKSVAQHVRAGWLTAKKLVTW